MTLDNGDPADIANIIGQHIGVELQTDGSWFVKAHLLITHNEATEQLLQSIVIQRLGLGRWLEGPIVDIAEPADWRWGGQYLPEDVDIPDDASSLQF